MPLKSAQTFGRDLEELFARHQTFAEALAGDTPPIPSVMTRQRLKIWWHEMCQELDLAGLTDAEYAENTEKTE